MKKALSYAKGPYQRAIIMGKARLSGADLQGAAKKYSGSYKKSRENLLKRLKEAGIPFHIAINKHGMKFIQWGSGEGEEILGFIIEGVDRKRFYSYNQAQKEAKGRPIFLLTTKGKVRVP